MPWQFVKYYRRPFQSLFYSMDIHLKEARELHKEILSQNKSEPQLFDQELWLKEKAAARACFIMGIAGIEAFTNNILEDFQKRNKAEIPNSLLNDYQSKNPIKRWHIIDKLFFLPTICNDKYAPPTTYFHRESHNFKLFEELIKIRNSIMHGKFDPFPILVKLKPDRIHELDDSIEQNFWPISKIPRDFSAFNYDCAKISHNNIRWAKVSLIKYIKDIEKSYLKDEVIEEKSRIIGDAEFTQDELISNWENHISNAPGRKYKLRKK